MPILGDNRRRIRVQPQPLCPVHRVPMIASSSTAAVRYFRCKAPGCRCTDKQSRLGEAALRESLFGRPGAYP